jgi:hypothetical protein
MPRFLFYKMPHDRRILEEIIANFLRIPVVKNDVGDLSVHGDDVLLRLIVSQVIPITIDFFNRSMASGQNYVKEIRAIIDAIKKDDELSAYWNGLIDHLSREAALLNKSLSSGFIESKIQELAEEDAKN